MGNSGSAFHGIISSSTDVWHTSMGQSIAMKCFKTRHC